MGDNWLELSIGIPIAYAILTLLSAVPFVGIGTGVLTLILILQSNSRVQELYDVVSLNRGAQGTSGAGSSGGPEIATPKVESAEDSETPDTETDSGQ